MIRLYEAELYEYWWVYNINMTLHQARNKTNVPHATETSIGRVSDYPIKWTPPAAAMS